jgi:hypothetical protein
MPMPAEPEMANCARPPGTYSRAMHGAAAPPTSPGYG